MRACRPPATPQRWQVRMGRAGCDSCSMAEQWLGWSKPHTRLAARADCACPACAWPASAGQTTPLPSPWARPVLGCPSAGIWKLVLDEQNRIKVRSMTWCPPAHRAHCAHRAYDVAWNGCRVDKPRTLWRRRCRTSGSCGSSRAKRRSTACAVLCHAVQFPAVLCCTGQR